MGRADDIPNAGDYFVKNIDILGTSLLIVRGEDGKVRGFHNTCCHRGNRVAVGNGNGKFFDCGFHGWTYDNQGQLVNVPDEELYFNLDKSALQGDLVSTLRIKPLPLSASQSPLHAVTRAKACV